MANDPGEAFTVGHVASYDASLVAAVPGYPPMKRGRDAEYDGGWVWATAAAAEATAALARRPRTFLGSEEFAAAFPGRDAAGSGWDVDVSLSPASDDGVHRLLSDAPILGRARAAK